MKKEVLFVGFIALFLLSHFVSAEIIISEVELNPLGEDRGSEWIELYSEEKINLGGWELRSSNGRNMSLTGEFSGYYSFFTKTNLLTNEKNTIKLANANKEVVFATKELNDNYNNDKSWQYCSTGWVFDSSTMGKENKCVLLAEEKANQPDEEDKTSDEDSQEENKKNEEKENAGEIKEENVAVSTESSKTAGDIIILGSSSQADEDENRIVYKSKKEYIKEYAIYGFFIFCIALLSLLLAAKIRKNKKENIEEELE
jgi:hypothetical protein